MAAAAPMIMAGGQAVSQMGNAYVQSRASQQQGRMEKQAAKLNVQLDEMRSADAIKRGQFLEAAQRRKTRGLVGSQRASMAAQGIDLSFGSGRDITQEAMALGEMDAQTTRMNAYKEAFGYKVSASEARLRGKLASIAGKGQAKSILLTGGMQAAQSLASGFGQMQQNQLEQSRWDKLYGAK